MIVSMTIALTALHPSATRRSTTSWTALRVTAEILRCASAGRRVVRSACS